jgi:hypothetical protein
MKKELLESIIFFIVALITYLYVKKNNPDKIIDRYYISESIILYNIFKISSVIIYITLMFNFKYLIILFINKYVYTLI